MPEQTITVGPQDGTIHVHTHREGVAARVGHDLVIEVERWSATVQTQADGQPARVELTVDSGSLRVREGHNGLKPLSEKDRGEIRKNIDEKVLRGQEIVFRSDSVQNTDGGLEVHGRLSIGAASQAAVFTLAAGADGRLTGTLPVVQSAYGITPYKAMMGALKVSDTLEIVLDVRLPRD